MLQNPTSLNAELEAKAYHKWQELAEAKKYFLLKRSKILWLANGDAWTSYYHWIVATRRAINHIHFLTDESGTWYNTNAEIEGHCVDYFSNLLGTDIEPQCSLKGI